MTQVNIKNNKQDIDIGKLQVEVTNIKDAFDKFITNDFWHLNRKVDRLMILVITGILIPIVLYIIQR